MKLMMRISAWHLGQIAGLFHKLPNELGPAFLSSRQS